jgi:glycerophosphoryl diester phosphodiesterase
MSKNFVKRFLAYTAVISIIGTGCAFKLCKSKSQKYEGNVISYVSSFTDDEFELAAHRGFSSLAVENTIDAFKLADEAPYVDYIELDIRLADDGEIICSHDSFVRNIKFQKWYLEQHKGREAIRNTFTYTGFNKSNFFSSIFSTTDGYIIRKRQLELLNDKFSLSTLNDALDACSKTDVIIDIKFNDDFDVLTKKLIDIIKDIDSSKLILQSSNLELLRKLQSLYPNYNYSAIIDDVKDFEKCSSFQMIGVKKSLVSIDSIKSAFESGQSVSVWTVNSTDDVKDITSSLGDYYDDVIYITDYPDVIAHELNLIKLEKKKVTN